MPQEINFLSKQKEIAQSRATADKKSLVYLIVISVITAIAYASVLAVDGYYQVQANQIKQDIATTKQKIEAASDAQEDYLAFYEKAQMLSNILSLREGGVETLKQTYDHFQSADVAIVSSIYDYDAREVELRIECNSLFSLEELLTKAQDPEFRQLYPNVTLTGLTRSNNGTFQLKMILEI